MIFVCEVGNRSAHLKDSRVCGFIIRYQRELIGNQLRIAETSCGEIGRLEFLECLRIELGFKLLEHMGKLYDPERKWSMFVSLAVVR